MVTRQQYAASREEIWSPKLLIEHISAISTIAIYIIV